MRLALAIGIALGIVAGHGASAHAQTFRRPVACDACIANWYYFDNLAGAGLRDWNCAMSTYDGHRGSDFSLAGNVDAIPAGHDVVAAADGMVVSTEDGHYDRCRTCNASVDARCGTGFGSGYGNHVVINHGSYRTIYAHLRQGSVRVRPGDTVRCGDAIGQIGSSGCSTGAHLHFETRPLGGAYTTAFDPFAGGCSPTSPSRWTAQGGHRSMPAPTCDGTATCPSGTYPIWTCDAGRTSRRRCIDGNDMTEPCRWGCVSMPVGTDDVCAPPPDADGDGSPADEDCDDADPGRFPGNPEVCGDGIDQDCDGADLPCAPLDAGVPALDGGASEDGGASALDAALPPLDGAVAPGLDAGRGGSSLDGTCTCRTIGARAPGAPLGALVLAFVALRRRR
ncbi:MAG: peptidoglycan DD-metalloendopeptidase family protein [Sandaracinaceae bacterium]|nr:peptidoglycan DD-metalloendopeptidase family protein [Sandaracinaceae bacterium]